MSVGSHLEFRVAINRFVSTLSVFLPTKFYRILQCASYLLMFFGVKYDTLGKLL